MTNAQGQLLLNRTADIRVLLVEDNEGDARLVRYMLEEVAPSFELTRAQRLVTALEYLDRSTYDVVLLDLSLPDARGLEKVSVQCAPLIAPYDSEGAP